MIILNYQYIDFELYRQDSSDKYVSLAVCFRNTVSIVDHEYFSYLNALKFVILALAHLRKKHSFYYIKSTA